MPANLALRMRPKSIDEVIGQEHLVGPGKIIRRMIDANMLSSMILYGPPGIGKTSIASAIAGTTKYAFRTFNATTDNQNACRKSLKRLSFLAVWFSCSMKSTALTRPSRISCSLFGKWQYHHDWSNDGKSIFSILPAIRSRVQILNYNLCKPAISDRPWSWL